MVYGNIVFIGETDAGKSSLIKKYMNPSAVISNSISPDHYWRVAPNSPQHFNLEVDGQHFDLTINEVSGSRGRSSNYYELRTACAKADLIVYCCSTSNKWSLRNVDYINNIIQSPGKNKQNEQVRNIPYIVVETCMDLPLHESNAKEVALHNGVKYVACSAVTGENVSLVFETIAKTLVETKANSKVEVVAKKVEVTQKFTETAGSENKSIFRKLFDKLFTTETKKKDSPTITLSSTHSPETVTPPAA